jgi:hypothetical protein
MRNPARQLSGIEDMLQALCSANSTDGSDFCLAPVQKTDLQVQGSLGTKRAEYVGLL